ncbi:MAG: hypothetical protein WBO24_16700, partial [Nitrospirales bacterium]
MGVLVDMGVGVRSFNDLHAACRRKTRKMNRLKSNQFSVMGIGEPATLEPVVEGRSEMKTPNQFKISASGFAGGLQLSIIEQWHHILQVNWTTLR